MNYENLYNQAMNGNADALEELKADAGSGNAQAQFILSCIYDNIDSPFPDESLSIYWLKKSADNKYEPAIKKFKEFSPDAKNKFGLKKYNDEDVSIDYSDATKKEQSGFWSFQGRVNRKTFWETYLIYLFIGSIIYIVSPFALAGDPKIGTIVAWSVAKLIPIYLFFALCSKRMHDCGYSGWWQLIPFSIIVLLFMKGEEKINKYGPVPR